MLIQARRASGGAKEGVDSGGIVVGPARCNSRCAAQQFAP